MLCVNNYNEEYIHTCRLKINAQLAAYKKVVLAAADQPEFDDQLDAAIDAFNPLFYDNLLVFMDALFTHRNPEQEAANGGPLSEVRMLVNSILNHDNVMTTAQFVNYVPAKAVLKIEIGDKIQLDGADFQKLFAAFFADLERKFL